MGAPSARLTSLALIAALACCSPEGDRHSDRAPQLASAVAATSTPAAPATRATPPASPAAGASAPKPARRCGWLVNPTPGNWWLYDRDGEWILATQGSEAVRGMEDMPDMSTAGWVETNGHYGYGCACVTITSEPSSRRVTSLSGASPKPLSQCRADKRLPRP